MSPARALLLAVAGLTVAWQVIVPPILEWRARRRSTEVEWDPEPYRAGLIALWLVGATILLASQQIWFPRQLYILLLPFALLVGMLLEYCHENNVTDRRVPLA